MSSKLLLVVITLSLLTSGDVLAAPSHPEPSDYFSEEFIYGLLGGAVTGPFFEFFYVGLLCSKAPDPALCEGLGLAAMRIVVYGVTLPLGATVGIVMAGGLRGVDSPLSKWFFTYISAMMGSLTGWLTAAGVVQVMDFLILSFGWDFLRDWIAPASTLTRLVFPVFWAALWGTLVYNIDAKMSAPPPNLSASVSVPLLALRF